MEALLLVLLALPSAKTILGDPYDILGVSRSSSITDIRKTYKQLAREWHPDKNGGDPAAESKFVEINKAYELLSDPERRRQFDKHGVTEDTPNFRQSHDYSQYGRFEPHWDDLFGFGSGSGPSGGASGGFRFRFGGPDGSLFRKLSVSTKAYETTVLPKSQRQPYLVMFYSDWCTACVQVEPVWRRAVEELEPVGLGIATAHAQHEATLARRLGVVALPHLVLVVDGKVFPYQDSIFSTLKLVEFVRAKLPSNLVTQISDLETLETFLEGWKDNRVRVLVLAKAPILRLRYLLVAFYFRERAAFGYLKVGTPEWPLMRSRLGLTSSGSSSSSSGSSSGTSTTTATEEGKAETVLVFKEETGRPVASLSMAEIPVQALRQVVESNQFLELPRLSSQKVFDLLCPPEASRPRRRLCVVLVSADNPSHDVHRQALRHFARDSGYSPDRVRFAYVFRERQEEFIRALVHGGGAPGRDQHQAIGSGGPEEEDPQQPWLVILWRKDRQHLKFESLPGGWRVGPQQWNRTRQQLTATLYRLVASNAVLSHETLVKELLDEHAQGLLTRILQRLVSILEFLQEKLSKQEVVPALSVLVTVLFVAAGGYIMSYLVKLEEESIQEKYRREGRPVPGTAPAKKVDPGPQLKLHELRGETYNGMVRLLKPGCRTLVLLVDTNSRSSLVPPFHAAVWPFRKNRSLLFGFMHLERGLEWYRSLLQLSLPEPRTLQINPRNCVGTVLSLNGHRKYFCMFHAKHPEATSAMGSAVRNRKNRVAAASGGTRGGTSSSGGSNSRAGGNGDGLAPGVGGVRQRVNGTVKMGKAAQEAGGGAFMGFESTSDSESSECSDVESGRRVEANEKRARVEAAEGTGSVLFQEHLLDGLPNWLDRLFEGSTRRYHINYWPDFPIK